MIACCNDGCGFFNYFHEHNCEDWKLHGEQCAGFKEMKKKDLEVSEPEGMNEKFLVSNSMVAASCNTLEEAEKEVTDDTDRIFRIVQSVEYKRMGWAAQESYQDDYTNTKGV